MKITIVGAGNVGATLGKAWAARKHDITFAVPDPGSEKVQAAVDACGVRARATGVTPAAAMDVDIIVLATPGDAAIAALSALAPSPGSIVVDATNPIALDAEGLRAGPTIGHSSSGAEVLAAAHPQLHIVKAFNTIGAVNMAQPMFPEGAATMFICGDDADAKALVRRLSDELGFATEDAGTLDVTRLLEPMAMLWIHLAFAQGWGTGFGLRVVRRA